MKKKMFIVLTTTGLILGIFGLLFTPFINPVSTLYSATKNSTKIIFTPEAAASDCENDACIGGTTCKDGHAGLQCNMIGSGCNSTECAAAQ